MGRAELAAQLAGLVMNSAACSVIGMGRVGKSSLKDESVRLMRTLEPDIVVADVDILGAGHAAEVAWILLDAIEDVLPATVPRPDSWGHRPAAAYDAWRVLNVSLERMRPFFPRGRIVIVVDELDRVVHLPDGAEVLRRLRVVANQVARYGVVFAFVSRRPIRALETMLLGSSTLDGMCSKVYVRPLSREDTDALVDRGATRWCPSSVERDTIHAISGGHPLYAEWLLWGACEGGAMEAGVQHAIPLIFQEYNVLRLELGAEFEQLLQVAVGPRWSVRAGCPEQLRNYGIVATVGDGGERSFRGWSTHFQLYLEYFSRETPAWELWRHTECALRDMVEEGLSARLGAQWEAAIRRSSPSMESIFRGAEERRERESRNFPAAESLRLLDYTYPGDVTQLILQCWMNFSSRLGRDKAYWSGRFALLAKLRTPAAHGREHLVSESERVTAEGYCKQIVELLGGERTT